MYRIVWMLPMLASLVTVAACAPTVNVEQERTALMTVDREWSQTTKEPDKFVTYLADGATVYPPGMPMVTGSEALKKMFTEMNKAPGFELTWTPAKAEVSAGGDIGYTTGTYLGQMGGVPEKGKVTSPCGGSSRTDRGRRSRTSSTRMPLLPNPRARTQRSRPTSLSGAIRLQDFRQVRKWRLYREIRHRAPT